MESTHRNPQHQSLASTGTYIGKCTCKQMCARTCPPHTQEERDMYAISFPYVKFSNKQQTTEIYCRDYSLYFVGLEVLVSTEVDTIIILFT